MSIFGPNVAALAQKRDVPALLKLLLRDDVHLRCDVIHALGDLRDRAAVPALTAILADERHLVSEDREAAQALGKIGDPSAIDTLRAASRASIAREKAAIEEATAPAEKPYRPGFYINQISTEEFTLRSEIAQALSQIATPPALDALFEMLANESGWMESTVRESIGRAISQMLKREDASQAQILLERVRHASPLTRQAAAYYLREFRGDAVIQTLMQIARNEKEEYAVREAALGSLGKIADEKLLNELDELAQGANRAIARLAAHAAMETRQRRQSLHEQT